MDFIKNQSRKFNSLVLEHFIKKYKLKKTSNIKDLKQDNKNVIWIKNNYMIISNSIINSNYKTKFDTDKYSLVTILYKNLYYKETNKEKGKQNICYLDFTKKNQIKNIWSKFSNFINLDKNSIVISRKYYNKHNVSKKYFNCFGLLCFHPIEDVLKKKRKFAKNKLLYNKDDNNNLHIDVKHLRRNFLYNLKSYLGDVNSIYLKTIINKSVFIDTEYINDIYDDFKKFPISKDNSLLCMIGMYYLEKDSMKYDNLTVEKLDKTSEYYMLKNFLNRIENIDDVIIFHWSNADKIILEKSLIKYNDLWSIYSKKKCTYIDLLKIVKKTVYLKSYSLKYVSQILLKYNYETECKNGLDAMCSIILNNEKLITTYKNNNDYNKSINDIIQYNKIDTQLLYVILKHFIKN